MIQNRFSSLLLIVILTISISLIWPPQSTISQNTAWIIETIAGTGTAGFSGDGGPAIRAQFGTISALAVDGQGNLYLSDLTNHRIRRIAPDGTITSVAGTGTPGFNGDQRPASTAQIAAPSGLTVDPSARLTFADLGNHRIRRIAGDGMISTIAGNGRRGFEGDGGPALAASFSYPSDVVFDPFGNFYVTDVGNIRVRRIDANGIVTTMAGDGRRAFAGDGDFALNASFKGVAALALTPTNDLLIVDRFSHRVRQVDHAAVITTVVGNGTFGYNGDTIPATQASMRLPQDVVVDEDSRFYVADWANHRVRTVGPDGTITTLTGNGNPGFNGDGGPAESASLNGPTALALDSSGNLYVADSLNYRIRVVRPSR